MKSKLENSRTKERKAEDKMDEMQRVRTAVLHVHIGRYGSTSYIGMTPKKIGGQ